MLGELKGLRAVTENESESRNVSPVLKFVQELSMLEGKQFYVASQVASTLGISVQAVRKYTKNKVCGEGKFPSFKVKFSKKLDEEGGIDINLYTEEDIQALREFLGKRQVVYKT